MPTILSGERQNTEMKDRFLSCPEIRAECPSAEHAPQCQDQALPAPLPCCAPSLRSSLSHVQGKVVPNFHLPVPATGRWRNEVSFPGSRVPSLTLRVLFL